MSSTKRIIYSKGPSRLTYSSWMNMRTRCLNPNCKCYPEYGGRGITIDPSWNSFEQFLRDMGERPSLKYSIERINNDLGYYQ